MRFEASAVVQLRPLLFWDVMQDMLVVKQLKKRLC
jgi:hypothetical protein